MKNYANTDNHSMRDHILEVTLQSGEYKGTIQELIGGNCLGLNLLHYFDPDDLGDGEIFYKNSCNLKIMEGREGDLWYTCQLTNDDGDVLICEDLVTELSKMVVKLEIIDCRVKN